MRGNRLFILCLLGMLGGIGISVYLRDPAPFQWVAGLAIGAKGAENVRHGK